MLHFLIAVNKLRNLAENPATAREADSIRPFNARSLALSILLVAAAPWVVVVGEELTAGRSAAASGHSERGTAAAGD